MDGLRALILSMSFHVKFGCDVTAYFMLGRIKILTHFKMF